MRAVAAVNLQALIYERVKIMGCPAVIARVTRRCGASLGSTLRSRRFRTFAYNAENGFVGLTNCFVAAVRQNTRPSSISRRQKAPRETAGPHHAKFIAAWLADPLPGLTATKHSAEGAALNAQRVRSLHGDRGVVSPAAVGIMDVTDPFCVLRSHVDENFLVARHGISAQVWSATLAPHVSFFFLGGPHADRGRRCQSGRRGNGGRRRRGRCNC